MDAATLRARELLVCAAEAAAEAEALRSELPQLGLFLSSAGDEPAAAMVSVPAHVDGKSIELASRSVLYPTSLQLQDVPRAEQAPYERRPASQAMPDAKFSYGEQEATTNPHENAEAAAAGAAAAAVTTRPQAEARADDMQACNPRVLGEGIEANEADWRKRYKQVRACNIQLLDQLSATRAESDRALAAHHDRLAAERAVAEARLRALAEERSAMMAALQADPDSQGARVAELLHRQAFLTRYNAQLEEEVAELREGLARERGRLEKAQAEGLNLGGKAKVLERCLDALRATNAGLFARAQALEALASARASGPAPASGKEAESLPEAPPLAVTADRAGGLVESPSLPSVPARGLGGGGGGVDSPGTEPSGSPRPRPGSAGRARRRRDAVPRHASQGADSSPQSAGPLQRLAPVGDTGAPSPVSAKRLGQAAADPPSPAPAAPDTHPGVPPPAPGGRPVPAKSLSPAQTAAGAGAVSAGVAALFQSPAATKLWPFGW